jgi:hypothetical protein
MLQYSTGSKVFLIQFVSRQARIVPKKKKKEILISYLKDARRAEGFF